MKSKAYVATAGPEGGRKVLRFDVLDRERGWNSWQGFAVLKAESMMRVSLSDRIVSATLVVQEERGEG